MLTVRFGGRKYLFVGNHLKDGGPLCTRRQYSRGENSFANLFSDGKIRRYGEVVGDKSEITIVSRSALAPKLSPDNLILKRLLG